MRLKAATLAAFAAPALPLAALYFPVYVFLPPFYAAERGLSLTFIGAALIAIRLFDAVSDPAMGLISDRFTTRWGRRRPWLAVGAPVVMAAVAGLFLPPESAGAVWFTALLFALTLGWTVMLTPYYAWAAELSTDYAERARITVWRDTVGLVGTIGAAVAFSLGVGSAAGMANVAALILLTLPVGVFWCLSVVPEPRDHSTAAARPGAIWATLREEPLFSRLLGAYILNGAANALPATLFLFFVSDRLGAPDWGGPLLVLYFGAAVAGAPLWIYGLRFASKHRLWCWAMIYASAVFACALFLREGDVLAFAVICVASGLALGADLALPAAVQADLVDLDTARSGRQRTGAFFALWSLATKGALALAGGAALLILGQAGFESQAANTPGTLTLLSALYALAPVLLKLAAIAVMWRFPLDAARQVEVRCQIEAG
ncbi:MAG: MFS transporter [Pseudomonadota bacterium]